MNLFGKFTSTIRTLQHRATYANVMSTIAVLVAVGTGTAFAAATITGTMIVNGTIDHYDIKTKGLAGGDVKDATLTSRTLGTSSVTTSKILNRTVGMNDLSLAAIAALQDLESATCVRDEQNGDLSVGFHGNGTLKLFCEIDLDADFYDSTAANDTAETATAEVDILADISDYANNGITANHHTTSDEDWYLATYDCNDATDTQFDARLYTDTESSNGGTHSQLTIYADPASDGDTIFEQVEAGTDESLLASVYCPLGSDTIALQIKVSLTSGVEDKYRLRLYNGIVPV